MLTSKNRNMLLALALAVATGCAATQGPEGPPPGDDDPQPGRSFLTIVGDKNVFMENGWRQRITVRYHDDTDAALAGTVDFAIRGTANGSTLSGDSGVTNADGVVAIDVVATANGDAAFTVVASAELADPVEWRIAVSSGPPPLPPLDVTGKYVVQSDFDIVSGVPGTVGTVINSFIEMTDDPYDPASFILDKIVEQIGSGPIASAIDLLRPALDGLVNEAILGLAPDFVDTILDIGDKLGQVSRQFGVTSTLEVSKTGGIEGDELVAKHTITGIYFTIDGVKTTFSMPELSMTDIPIENVAFSKSADDTKVTIGEHGFPLSYGTMLVVALNEVIIPQIVPGADNLPELLLHYINCTEVGNTLADEIGFGSPSLYEGACELGLNAAGFAIEAQLRSIDGEAVVVTIHGDARPVDNNTDRKVDVLQNGLWEGTISYAGTPATLARPDNKFRGDRMAIP